MRLVLLVLFLLLIACGKKDEKSSELTDEQLDTALELEDSLNAAADSIADERRLHAMYTGAHVHNPKDNLAQVAHQDPELDRNIRKSIQENRERQIEVYEEQNKKMFDQIRKMRKQSEDTIARDSSALSEE